MRFSPYLILICLCCAGCSKVEKEQSPPNVVLILVDDYGYGDISFEGNTQIQTPHIDRIAQEGVQLTRFYQSSGACAPTRASLLTGRYHLRTGVWGVHWGRDYISLDEVTLGDVFHGAGYATGAFGKWHSGKSAGYHSWDRGFDVGLESSLYNYFDTKVLFDDKLIRVDGPITDVVGDQAVRFIEANKDNPFLCYLPFQAIHEPFNCPPEIFEKYKAQGYTDHVARLYGMIEVLDNNVGKVLEALDANQLSDNTVVLFMVDDGPSPGYDLAYSNRRMNPEERAERERAWGRQLRGGKASIWEGGSVSPCYIRWPGTLDAGRKMETVTGVIDVLPTLADICGIDLSAHPLPLDGRSFYPLLKDPQAEWPERYYFDNTNFYQIPMDRIDMEVPEMRQMSALHDSFKYVRIDYRLINGGDSLSHQLYNLRQDPTESENIAAEYPDITAELRSATENWYQEILESGRAFKTPVFQVGDWSEPGVFINGDAFAGKSPDLERNGFPIVGWENAGAEIRYDVNVKEEGRYRIELLYEAEAEGFGSEFIIGTENDSTRLDITDGQRAVSGLLNLPVGPQRLKIRLEALSPGGQSIRHLRHVMMYREPSPDDAQVLRNLGCEVGPSDQAETITVPESHAVIDFFTRPATAAVQLNSDDSLVIRPFCDNMEALGETRVWLDFEMQQAAGPARNKITLSVSEPGLHTVNVELVGKKGTRNVIRFLVERK